MAVNTDFYGDTLGLMIKTTYTNSNIYLANFSGVSSPNEAAGHLVTGVDAGRFAFGTPLDGSIQTHGTAKNDDTYNTLLNYGGFDILGSSSNTVTPSGNVGSVPVLWGYHLRNPSSSVTDYPQPYTTGYTGRLVERPDVLWKSGGEKSLDAFSMNPVVKMDFKNIIVVPLVFASTDTYNSTPDEYGRYTLNESSFASMYCYTLDTYINTDFITRPTVHGIGYMSFLCDIDANGNISFDNIRNFLPYSMQAVPNLLYNFSACEKISNNILPAAGNVFATGNDYTSPVIPGNGLVINYTTTTGSAYTINPSSGNIPFILGTTVRLEGTRQLTDITYGDRYKGCTVCSGRNHIAIIKLSSNQWSQRPVWFDAPQDPQMFKETVHKMISYLGVMWADEVGGIETGDTPVYIGVIDDNGLTTGTYQRVTTPDDIKQLASNDWINDNTYDPGRIDPNTYSDETELRPMALKTANIFNKLYLCNWDMYQLATYLYGIVAPSAASADEMRQKFLNANPIDCIVSLMYFPFELQPYFNGELQQIKLGNQAAYYELQSGTRMPITGFTQDGTDKMQIILDLGSCVYFPTFGDFRDYEPYSSADLVIPYHGTISINPAEYMGHQIGVKCIVDLATGASIAYIFRDGLAVDSIPGTIGVQIPVSGIATADYNNAAFSAAAQLNAAKITQTAGFMSDSIGIVSAAMSANPLGVAAATSKFVTDSAASANAVDVAQYNVNHIKIPYRQTGTATPATSTAADQTARLIVRRPKMLQYDPEQFAHLNGFSCLRFGNLSEFSGYTVCSDVHITGNATAEEKNMIKSLLQSGVIL